MSDKRKPKQYSDIKELLTKVWDDGEYAYTGDAVERFLKHYLQRFNGVVGEDDNPKMLKTLAGAVSVYKQVEKVSGEYVTKLWALLFGSKDDRVKWELEHDMSSELILDKAEIPVCSTYLYKEETTEGPKMWLMLFASADDEKAWKESKDDRYVVDRVEIPVNTTHIHKEVVGSGESATSRLWLLVFSSKEDKALWIANPSMTSGLIADKIEVPKSIVGATYIYKQETDSGVTTWLMLFASQEDKAAWMVDHDMESVLIIDKVEIPKAANGNILFPKVFVDSSGVLTAVYPECVEESSLSIEDGYLCVGYPDLEEAN